MLLSSAAVQLVAKRAQLRTPVTNLVAVAMATTVPLPAATIGPIDGPG
jgi:hypothetical protein